MGVTTYFLLAGYRPFDRENQRLEKQAVIASDWKFKPGMFDTNQLRPILSDTD